jgi:hypothetical protein
VKHILGIHDLLVRRPAAPGAVRRFTCGPRSPRRPTPGLGWGGGTALEVADRIFRRCPWRVVDPDRRRHPTEDDLRWLEEEIGAALPADYRLFVGAYGWTGFPEALRFPLRQAGPFGADAELSSFLGFSSELRRDLAYLVSEAYADSLPAGTIPIAVDPRENLLLLSVADTSDTRIWFWDRECRGMDAQIDAMVMDLEAEGEDTLELDENQILRRWEALFPERVRPVAGGAPAGFTNVYAVADSFATFLGSLYPAHAS